MWMKQDIWMRKNFSYSYELTFKRSPSISRCTIKNKMWSWWLVWSLQVWKINKFLSVFQFVTLSQRLLQIVEADQIHNWQGRLCIEQAWHLVGRKLYHVYFKTHILSRNINCWLYAPNAVVIQTLIKIQML